MEVLHHHHTAHMNSLMPHLVRVCVQVPHQCIQAEALVTNVHKDVIATVECAEGQLANQVVLQADGQLFKHLRTIYNNDPEMSALLHTTLAKLRVHTGALPHHAKSGLDITAAIGM